MIVPVVSPSVGERCVERDERRYEDGRGHVLGESVSGPDWSGFIRGSDYSPGDHHRPRKSLPGEEEVVGEYHADDDDEKSGDYVHRGRHALFGLMGVHETVVLHQSRGDDSAVGRGRGE